MLLLSATRASYIGILRRTYEELVPLVKCEEAASVDFDMKWLILLLNEFDPLHNMERELGQ